MNIQYSLTTNNMREIKFRAWDRDKKEMMRVNELTLDAQFDAGWSFMRPYPFDEYWKSQDPRERKYTNFPPYTNHVVLMQYTGLKDDLGGEIYEGDILRIKLGASIEEGERIRGIPLKDFSLCPKFIIGNIYENPDLLPHQPKEQ